MDADLWEACANPQAMIQAAGDRVSARKWRLFMAAAVRDARRHHLLPVVADAIELAERAADGLVADDARADGLGQLGAGWRDSDLACLLAPLTTPGGADRATRRLCRRLDGVDWVEGRSARRAVWLREVVGNPFRWVRWEDEWLTRTVHALAAPAYAAGRFDTLPVLADALEDAGCDNEELVAHLRGPGPHARGCWALDVVLGKV